jgi:cbb3-type cytochrome oxidase subunit 3
MIEWLSHYSGLIVLVGFSTAFFGIALWVLAPMKKNDFARYARIPLQETDE